MDRVSRSDTSRAVQKTGKTNNPTRFLVYWVNGSGYWVIGLGTGSLIILIGLPVRVTGLGRKYPGSPDYPTISP